MSRQNAFIAFSNNSRGGSQNHHNRGRGNGRNNYNQQQRQQQELVTYDPDVFDRSTYRYAPVRPLNNPKVGPNALPFARQPFVTLDAQHVFNFTHFNISKNDSRYNDLNCFAHQMKLVRRSIMEMWKDDNAPINEELLNKVPTCNPKPEIFTVPSYLDVKIDLPCRPKNFNNYRWGILYRAMLPGISKIHFTLTSFKTYASIFESLMTCIKTACRNIILEQLIETDRRKLEKQLAIEHIPFNGPEHLKRLSALRFSYKNKHNEKMKEIREHYDNYIADIQRNATEESVNPLTHPEMIPVWERITCNIFICGIHPYVKSLINDNNIKMFFPEYIGKFTVEDYSALIRALREKFFSDYPDYDNSNMFEIDDTDPAFKEIYDRKCQAKLEELKEIERARVAEAIRHREEEDAAYYAAHPEELNEEWNETYEEGNPEEGWYQPSDDGCNDYDYDEDDECREKPVYVSPADMELFKQETITEYTALHKAEIDARHIHNETIFENWKAVNKHCEVLYAIMSFKIQLEDFEKKQEPLDESKVDYLMDIHNPNRRVEPRAKQLEKSRIYLVLNTYSLIDDVIEKSAVKYEPMPKNNTFGCRTRGVYNSINLESRVGSQRITILCNSLDPKNNHIAAIHTKALFDIPSILPIVISQMFNISGNVSLATSHAEYLMALTTDKDTITSLMTGQTILNKPVIRSEMYWNLFWALFFANGLNITQSTVNQTIGNLLLACGLNQTNISACFKAFTTIHEFNVTNKINDNAQYFMVSYVIFNLGKTYLHKFKANDYYAVLDALELIDKNGINAYLSQNNLPH